MDTAEKIKELEAQIEQLKKMMEQILAGEHNQVMFSDCTFDHLTVGPAQDVLLSGSTATKIQFAGDCTVKLEQSAIAVMEASRKSGRCGEDSQRSAHHHGCGCREKDETV